PRRWRVAACGVVPNEKRESCLLHGAAQIEAGIVLVAWLVVAPRIPLREHFRAPVIGPSAVAFAVHDLYGGDAGEDEREMIRSVEQAGLRRRVRCAYHAELGRSGLGSAAERRPFTAER